MGIGYFFQKDCSLYILSLLFSKKVLAFINYCRYFWKYCKKSFLCLLRKAKVLLNSVVHVQVLFYFHRIKGSVMQIEKALINDCLRVSDVSWKFHIPTIYKLYTNLLNQFAISLKSNPHFNSFYRIFCL